MSQTVPSRRRHLLKGAALAAGSLAAPMISAAQTTTLRVQSAWPAKDIFQEYANDFAKKVNDMAGGRLRIDILPAGAVAAPFQLLDAVNKGSVDGGHGALAWHYGKSPALALWGTGPAFGMDANMVLSWHNQGGGRALLEEIYKSLNMDVVSRVYGPMATQPLGWFKKPLVKAEDFKGLKFRSAGLAVDLFTELGAVVNALPPAEIVPALGRGQLDAAEYNNASSDRALGLPEVIKNCMLQSFHQPAEQFEVLINKRKFDALPGELKAIIDYAIQASSAEMSWKAIDRNARDYDEMKKGGVKFYKTPDAILKAQLVAWDKVFANRSGNALFKKVLDSQRAFAERCVRWQNDYMVDSKMAYNYYFSKKA